LPLHGHTPGQAPVDPADALASLLLSLGVPAGQVPPGLEARMALWRDRLAERQLLLVLDDAASSEQVRPLLPGTGGSLVLVTSRRHLSALDDATAVSLDTLPPEEAAALLVRLSGRAGLSPADPAVAELSRLCGFLPLAIGMVGRQLHHHPAWSVAGRAAEVAAAVDRLELMATENLSVAAAFNLSYADLAEDQQRLFRRLGLHPGAEIDAYAAAALDGTDLVAARRGLEALYDQYLIAEPAAVPALAGREQALAWARVERASLLACLDNATGTGQHARVITLTAGLAGLLRDDGPWADAVARHTAAIQAARHLGDRLGQANALHDLAVARRLTGDYLGTVQAHEEALAIYRDLGNQLGQANVLRDLGVVRMTTSDYPAAVQAQEQALGIYRDLGERLGQANALIDLGVVRRLTGDYPAAAQALGQALGIYRDLGIRGSEAEALNETGTLYQVSGDLMQAERCHRQALELARAVASSSDEAHALAGLGRCALAVGHATQAEVFLRQALEIFQRIGAAEAPDLLTELDALTGLPPAQ
jgi:tetratricopeptide (TPR) repeat protein